MAIRTSVGVRDNMSAAFLGITGAINTCLGAFMDLQSSTEEGLNPAQFEAVQSSLYQMNDAAQQFADGLNDAGNKQDKFNQSMNRGISNADALLNKVKGIVGTYLSFKTLTEGMNLSDELASTNARLSLMDAELTKTYELQNMIMSSAQRARGTYLDMASAAAKLGNNAGAAFSNNSEQVVAFTELVQKQFKIGGASVVESKNAMLQLTQAMSSGVLRGDELRSIYEQAPNLIQNIAKYIQENEDVAKRMAEVAKVSYEEMSTNAMGYIRDLASEGQITASIVKNAMFYSADEINAKFETMPKTFSDVWTNMQNQAIAKMEPLMSKLGRLANSDNFNNVMSGFIDSVAVATNVAMSLIDILINGANFVQENWSIISPIIMGVAFALGAYNAVLLAHNAYQSISNGLKTISVIWSVAHGAAITSEMVATTGMTGAQIAFNAALLACPLTLIIAGIALAIVAIYAIVGAVNKAQGTTVSATGIIAGAFAVCGAFILNTFVIPLYNAFAIVSNFIGNVFNDPVAAVEVLFYDMAITVIGYISKMASAIETVINKIPGVQVDITSGLDNFYNGLKQAQQAVKDESGWREQVKQLDYLDYTKAAKNGYEFGKGIDAKVDAFFHPDTGSIFADDAMNGALGGVDLGNIVDNTGETAKNTGKALEITEENLAWMKDIAERDVIDRTVYRDISVNLGGVNNIVNNMTDLDGVADYLGNVIQEQMLVSAEGVHA